MTATSPKSRKRLVFPLIVLLLVGGGITAYFLRVQIPGVSTKANEPPPAAPRERLKVELVEGVEHTLSVPEEVRTSLGIRKGGKDIVAIAKEPTEGRQVTFSASTLFDPATIYRIRGRFSPLDVLKLERVPQLTDEGTLREIRPGDEIKAKQQLGEFYSVDLGAKKRDLIDALVQYKNDKEALDNAYSSFATPRILIITFEKAVQADIGTARRALDYLIAWKIPKDEIEEIYLEADRIFNDLHVFGILGRILVRIDLPVYGILGQSFLQIDQKSNEKKLNFDKSYDPDKPNKWGKIVLRAPFDAVIVEQNVSEGETLLDPTLNLFTLARVDRLLIKAEAPEEDVKELYRVWKKSGLQWTIRPLGEPDSDGITVPIDSIGYLADPNTHTVPIKGLIPNKDKSLRAGMYVTATIELPAPKDVVEIPANAVVDDGKQTVVFVQPDPSKPEYTMRRVLVSHRIKNKVYVRSTLTKKEKDLTPEEEDARMMPKEPLVIDERVITSGLLELKKELEDRESDKLK